MALVACPSCGRQCSELAATCPGCGRPVGPTGALVFGFVAGVAALIFFGVVLWKCDQALWSEPEPAPESRSSD